MRQVCWCVQASNSLLCVVKMVVISFVLLQGINNVCLYFSGPVIQACCSDCWEIYQEGKCAFFFFLFLYTAVISAYYLDCHFAQVLLLHWNVLLIFYSASLSIKYQDFMSWTPLCDSRAISLVQIRMYLVPGSLRTSLGLLRTSAYVPRRTG